MAKNLLVINVDIRETRVALIENGIIAELHIERETSKGTLGNIYLGKVSRVLPGMQAAFIDVGLERAAFLHVEDLIHPDDFEAYLAGHRRGTDDERSAGRDEAAEESSPTASVLAAPPAEPASAAAEEAAAEEAAAEEEEDEREVDIELPTALDVAEAGATADAPDDDDDELLVAERGADASADAAPEEPDAPDLAEAEEPAPPADDDEVDVLLVDEAEPAEASGAAEVPAGEIEAAAASPAPVELVRVPEEDAPVPRAGGNRRRRQARVRRSGRTTVPEAAPPAQPAARQAPPPPAGQAGPRQGSRSGGAASGATPRAPQEQARGRGRPGQGGAEPQAKREGPRSRRDAKPGTGAVGGDRSRRDGRPGAARTDGKKGHNEPPRISKATPIREVIREGQEVLVQISKEPIGTKGARVTSHISLPGRYVVYLPTVDHVGISKRIGSDRERSRLRDAIDAMKPPQGGLIVRTLAEGLTKKQLKADVGYLVRLWGEVVKKREVGERAPVCLYTELDLVLKTARDLFTDDIEKIVIDSREEYERLRRFIEVFLPERGPAIELYQGEEPIFDAYGIEDEIQRAQSRKVPLPSGGYLIIDQAEALTAIDVNTGRFVGKGSKDLEETILATNLEAVEEIAYQLRFRNIGGLIILDLIDMERTSNREKVRRRLEDLLAKDKAKTTLNRISDLGLIEMTRKRTRESLGRMVLEPCFYCDGTGQLQSKQTIAYEILRQIRRERMNLAGYVVVVNAHPAVIDLLKSDERVAVVEAERLFQRRIELVPRKEYHLEQFDLQGR
jgi:ribonuclease G